MAVSHSLQESGATISYLCSIYSGSMSLKTGLLALICGFVGGVVGFLAACLGLGHMGFQPQSSPVAYRATAYELVNDEGKVLGRWSSDREHGVTFTLFDERGFKAIEMSARERLRALKFLDGKDGWTRASLVAAAPGTANLTLGDDHRQGRLTIGDVDDRDVATDESPHVWGFIVRGAGMQSHLAAYVRNPNSKTATSGITITRPDNSRWIAQ
jgi:hypothetical protein